MHHGICLNYNVSAVAKLGTHNGFLRVNTNVQQAVPFILFPSGEIEMEKKREAANRKHLKESCS